MQYGHYYFQSRFFLFRVHVRRNTTAIVLNGDGVIGIDENIDVFTMSRQRLINRVVNYLLYQVMQSFYANVTNVHGRSFPYRFQSFQNLNTICGIIVVLNHLLCYVLAHFQ